DDDSGLELRYVPAVHAELPDLHRVLPQASELQLRPAPRDPSLRTRGEPGLHGVLPYWAVHGIWHETGAASGLGDRRRLGDLRWYLLPAVEQGFGPNNTGHKSCK